MTLQNTDATNFKQVTLYVEGSCCMISGEFLQWSKSSSPAYGPYSVPLELYTVHDFERYLRISHKEFSDLRVCAITWHNNL